MTSSCGPGSADRSCTRRTSQDMALLNTTPKKVLRRRWCWWSRWP